MRRTRSLILRNTRRAKIYRSIPASLAHRIEKVDWLSQTTKTNALDKLAHCGLYVAYPDQWYEDCVSSYANCETLVEAVHRNNLLYLPPERRTKIW